MSATVTTLPGVTIQSDEPRANVIAILEETLAEARRGEIIGFAAVLLRPNLEIGTRSSQLSGQRHLFVAGTVYLQADLAKED